MLNLVFLTVTIFPFGSGYFFNEAAARSNLKPLLDLIILMNADFWNIGIDSLQYFGKSSFGQLFFQLNFDYFD